MSPVPVVLPGHGSFFQAEGLAVVTSLVICPYTSYWQPNQPTYNPVEACIQLYHSAINEGKPYYESPRFRVAGSMMVRKTALCDRACEQTDCTAAVSVHEWK